MGEDFTWEMPESDKKYLKPRKWWLAALLGFVGFGQLYNRQLKKMLFFLLVPSAVLYSGLFLTVKLSNIFILGGASILSITIYLWSIIDAAVIARRHPSIAETLKPITFYLLILCVFLLGLVSPDEAVIKEKVVQAFNIPVGSMEPTLLIGDKILVDKMVGGKSPSRNDIIVFKYPQNRERNWIKRVAGLPGETIEIREKKLYINGVPKGNNIYVHVGKDLSTERDNFGPVKVPPGKCFVLGDNMDKSLDSRFWGFVPIEDIEGRAFVIYWSWDSEDHKVRWDRVGKEIPEGKESI